ncbi:MAG: glycosyltransferase, partial [Candidatus Binatia bacterium]
MTTLLAIFLAIAVVLWLSVFGYLLVLVVVARGRARSVPTLGDFPDVAVIVPTLNEQDIIASKLADLEGCDYPRERLTIVVVDGGSSDATIARVEEAMLRNDRIRLLKVAGAR